MMKSRRILTVDRRNRGVYPVYPASRAHLAREGQPSPACQPQVGQRKQHDDLPGIFRQFAVANVGEAELPLDRPERMLDDGAH